MSAYACYIDRQRRANYEPKADGMMASVLKEANRSRQPDGLSNK